MQKYSAHFARAQTFNLMKPALVVTNKRKYFTASNMEYFLLCNVEYFLLYNPQMKKVGDDYKNDFSMDERT